MSHTRGLTRPGPRPELDTPSYQIPEDTLNIFNLDREQRQNTLCCHYHNYSHNEGLHSSGESVSLIIQNFLTAADDFWFNYIKQICDKAA